MILQQRFDILVQIGRYMQNNSHEWQAIKEQASRANPWFVPEFIEMSATNIATEFLQRDKLQNWVATYNVPAENTGAKTVGVVMAGNIPMVGFHDLLCIFISGHRQRVKLSSKDEILIKHLVSVMADIYRPH